MTIFGFGTPFQEQIDYLVQKLRLPTDKWDDITRAAHDRAFIVAGAAKADLLADLHAAVIKGATDGAGLQAFQKDFKAIVAKHGWTGWTGEGTREGVAWRTQVIYQTNMATSYAAGRYQQMSDPEVLKLHPYWRYIHSDGVLNPRQQHLAWHGLTLLASHPFWQTHWAPNGFNCFPAETAVRCNAKLGLKTWYAGEMVEFSTANGNRLTVTANHPILTRRGWVCAQELNKDDELISASGNVDSTLVGVIDHKQSPTSAEDLFESLADQGLRVAPMSLDDFHGDALLRKPEIHIAGPDSALVDIAQSARSELIGEDGLKLGLHRHSESPLIAFSPARLFLIKGNPIFSQDMANHGFGNTQTHSNLRLTNKGASVQRQDFSLDGSVARVSGNPSSSKLALDASRCSLDVLPTQPLGLRFSTQHDTAKPQGSPQRIPATSALLSQLMKANPGAIHLDQIREIRKYQWCGHVYDFVTTSGLIMAGGIVVSNCHCRITSVSKAEGERSASAGLGEPPAGWDAIDPKTGEQVGIGKSFGYAPGRSWHPNLDKYSFDLAREVVADNLKDGVFERWLKFVDTRIEAQKLKPEYAGLTGNTLSMAVRKALSKGERVPVAVLDARSLDALKIEKSDKTASGYVTQTVLLSDDTAVKQTMHRAGQDLSIETYLRLQQALDYAQYVEINGGNKLVYFYSGDQWEVAVIKSAPKSNELFLVSMRKSSQREVDRAISKGASKWAP